MSLLWQMIKFGELQAVIIQECLGVRAPLSKWIIPSIKLMEYPYLYPTTPAFAKAGAVPGTTAGVEPVPFLGFQTPKTVRGSFDQALRPQHLLSQTTFTPFLSPSRPCTLANAMHQNWT